MNSFEEFLKRNRLRKTEVADYLNVSNSFITKLVNGSRVLSADRLNEILSNPEWDTSMLSGSTPGQKTLTKSNPKNTISASFIPLLPFSAVAGWMTDNNGVDTFRGESVVFKDFSERGADCMIRVDGDSMVPRYNNGDILAIKIIKDPTFFQWGKVYVLSTTQGCVVKTLMPDPQDEDKIICRSENSARFPDYKITKQDILAVAIVVGHAGVE